MAVVDAGLPMVSVVMPVRNEAAHLGRSLAAVFAQDYPPDRLEIIVADGQSTDGTRAQVEALQARHPQLKLIDNPGRIAPAGLNRAMAAAAGTVIARVDGHCEIAPDYVRRAVAHLREDDVDGVGGPIETIGETPMARVIAAAMSTPFGVGGSAFRTIKGRTMMADTIAFPVYTRAVIERAGPYDEELVRNQDDEYNYRLRKGGARLLLAADVRARYYSRSTLGSLCRQYFQYGFWKVRVLQKHPRQMSWRQFVPPSFVAGLIAAALLAALVPGGGWSLAALGGLWVVAGITASIGVVAQQGLPAALGPLLPVAFAVLHLAYGTGFLVGLVRFAGRW